MSNLQTLRQNAQLYQIEVARQLQTVEPQVDVPLVSKYEANICLPTPAQLQALCALFGCKPGDIYTPAEVDFGVKRQNRPKSASDLATYNLHVRLDKTLANDLQTALRAAGYAGVTDWVTKSAKRLIARQKRKEQGNGRH